MAFFSFSRHNMLESSKVCMHAGGPALRHSCGVMERGRRTGDVDYGSMICGSNSSSRNGSPSLPGCIIHPCRNPTRPSLTNFPLTLRLLAQSPSSQGATTRSLYFQHKWINCFISVWFCYRHSLLVPVKQHSLADKKA